jgi:hypothetical protein
MANPENLSQPRKQVSVERGGLGQSGYTAGRKEGDVSLDDVIDTRYVAPPGSASDGLGLDDRFTGRGGPVTDVEHDGPGEAVAQPYPSANGAPDPAGGEPDGASGRWDADRDDSVDRRDRTDRAGERADDRRA